MASFEDLLTRDGVLVYKTKGTSMEPMLRQNRDLVVIRVPSSRLHKYDVALYRRGGSYVLHRVMAVKDGYYLIRGDNTFASEIVPDDAIIGVLTSFTRKGRQCDVTEKGYQWYVRIWGLLYPLRFAGFCAYRAARAVARKIGITQLVKQVAHRE